MSIYRELRQVLERVVAHEEGALAAAQHYLANHCPSCGVALVAEQRVTGGWCERCAPPALPAPLAAEEHRADVANWPANVQETVRRIWTWPAVQTLLAELHQLGMVLPIRSRDGGSASKAQRLQLYQHPQALAAIVEARSCQVGARHLAAILFGAAPGGVSDEIAKRIGSADPAAAAVRPQHASAPPAPLVPIRRPAAPAARSSRRRATAPKAEQEAADPADPADPISPFSAWPQQLRDKVRALWEEPAVQQLRADLLRLDVPIPIRGQRRQAVLSRVEVMQVLSTAYGAGVSQRALAILVFGAPPGSASDEMGHYLDKHDPELRAWYRRGKK
ncbi:MAG TPA: hypothetical protein VFS21_02360 [Roseiflexaceae bacterium]|nr:hypothetical protein [Roseiflexaceae bacterium]